MAFQACAALRSPMLRAPRDHGCELRQPIVRRNFHTAHLRATVYPDKSSSPIVFRIKAIENHITAPGRNCSSTHKKRHYIYLYPQHRSLSTQPPNLNFNDNSKREDRSHRKDQSMGDNIGGHKIGDTTYGPNSPITKKNWIGGILVILIATSMLYIYCETNPDKELCESLRTNFGIKKKQS